DLWLLPTLWFRNTWAYGQTSKPGMRQIDGDKVLVSHSILGDITFNCEGCDELLFTENESNARRLWGQENPIPYVKDAFHEYVISGNKDAVNPLRTGTKAAALYRLQVPAGGSKVVRLRLSAKSPAAPFKDFDDVFAARLVDA